MFNVVVVVADSPSTTTFNMQSMLELIFSNFYIEKEKNLEFIMIKSKKLGIIKVSILYSTYKRT